MIRMAAKPSWLLLIFLALKNIWLVHPCPEYMNVYKGRCLERCPYGVKQVEFTNVCTERCPNNAPYLYNKITCVRFCPSDYVAVYPNRCARRIQILNIPGEGQKDSIINCPDEFCSSSSSKPFCYDLVCRERCPPNTFSDRFNCVHTCSGKFPYRYNSSCHAQCPPGAMVTEDNNCVVDCPSNTFLYGNTCVGICPENTFIHNRTCLSACPESDPLTLVFGNIKRCLPTCPVFTMRNGSVCELICPSNAMFLLNRTCVSTCPNFAPFILIKTITLYGIRKPLCVESCPDNTFLNGQTCVTKCDSNQFVLNSTCVSSCPNLYEATRVPYKCVDRCTGDMYLYRNICVETCPDSRFVSNQTCVSQCPQDKPYKVNGKNCVDKCPDNLNFMYQNNCRSDCPKHTHMLNNTCHDKCPKSYNILDHRDVYQSWYYKQNDASTSNCTRLCPFPLFNDSGICATRCSKNKFAFNRTCYVDCPSSHPLVLSRNASCVSHCPSNMVNAGNSCQFGCPTSTPYVAKRKCSEICPSTHPLHLTLNKSIPIYPFQQTLIYCVEQCHNHSFGSVEYYRFNDSCVKYCPPKTMGLKGFCVTTCSKTHKIMYTRTTESGETTECLQHCPNNMIEFNNTCIDEVTCSKVHSMFVYDGKTCIKECPYGFIQQLDIVQRCYSIPTEEWVTHGVLLIIFGICAVVIVLLIFDGFPQKKT